MANKERLAKLDGGQLDAICYVEFSEVEKAMRMHQAGREAIA